MMAFCPHCGHGLPEPLHDGVASCHHCSRVFSSTQANRLLSAAWCLKRYARHFEQFLHDTKLGRNEAVLVWSFIAENEYSLEEFQKALADIGIH